MEKNNHDLRFKTNVNCGGCVASVKPHLDNADGICHWDVDTTNKDKVTDRKINRNYKRNKLIETIQKAGFKIEHLTIK